MTLQPETWTHELGRRVRTLLVLKMLANLSGIAAFFYAYFWIMRHPLSAATVIPVTWIDDLFPFPLSPSSCTRPCGFMSPWDLCSPRTDGSWLPGQRHAFP